MGKIILVIVVLFFTVAIVKGCMELPETQNTLKNAPFLSDEEVHPEYDGQTVIVSGKLRSLGSCYDEDLMLTIESPCAVRYVEMLTETIDEDGYTCLTWTPIRRNREDEWLREKVLDGHLYLGGYELDASLIELLAPGREVGRGSFDAEEIAALEEHNIYPLTDAGTFYLSEVPRSDYYGDVMYDMYYATCRRVHYRMLDPNAELQYSIVGKAVDGRLVRDADVDTQPIFEGTTSHDQVVGQNLLYTILGMIVVIVILAVIAVNVFKH